MYNISLAWRAYRTERKVKTWLVLRNHKPDQSLNQCKWSRGHHHKNRASPSQESSLTIIEPHHNPHHRHHSLIVYIYRDVSESVWCSLVVVLIRWLRVCIGSAARAYCNRTRGWDNVHVPRCRCDSHYKSMAFVRQIMNLMLQTMNCLLKLMQFVPQTMNLRLQTMDYVLKLMTIPRCRDGI